MDIIAILFIVIGIISSIVRAANKSASKSGAPPQGYRPTFPPLSVDTPTQPSPEKVDIGSVPAAFIPYKGANDTDASMEGSAYDIAASVEDSAYDIAAPTARASMEMGSLPENADVYVKSADISPEIKTANIDLTELRMDLKTRYAPPATETTEAQIHLLNRLGLFKDRDEVVKAVIYSEIMRPKFKTR